MGKTSDYPVGSMVVYGLSGVCRVTAVGPLPQIHPKETDTRYYTLLPLWEKGTFYVPTAAAERLRPPMTAGEAAELLERAPAVPAPAAPACGIQQTEQYYRGLLKGGSPESWLKLLRSAEAHRQALARRKKRPGSVEERYRRQAERLLCEELAAALAISPQEAEERLAARLTQNLVSQGNA